MTGEPRRVTRVGAYAVCVEDRRLLLTRVAAGYTLRHDGWWTLPGGGIEHGEDPRDAAVRELEEETGLVGEVSELLEVSSSRLAFTDRDGDTQDYHGIRILYRCRVVGGQLRDEVGGSSDAARWFVRDELPSQLMVDIARLAVERIGLD